MIIKEEKEVFLSVILTVIALIAGGKAIAATYRKELDYAIALAILCFLCGAIALIFPLIHYTGILWWGM